MIFGNTSLIINVHAHIYIFPSWCSFLSPLIIIHLFLCHFGTCKQGIIAHSIRLGRCLCFPIILVMGWSQKYSLFWRGIPCVWTRCALLLQDNYNNGNSTSLSLCFSCAMCGCHWPALLIPTTPSVTVPQGLSQVCTMSWHPWAKKLLSCMFPDIV